MKNIKKLFAAAVFIGGAGFMASSAQAAPLLPTYGVPTVQTFDLGGGTTYTTFGDIFSAAYFNKTFSDMIPFTVAASSSNGTGQVGSTYLLKNNKTYDLNITGFNLLNATGTIVASGTNNNPLANLTHTADYWTINDTALSAGNYKLNVLGKVTGNAGGTYAGDFTVTAVPEPETYGMLLGGLGLIGFIARRKSAAKKAA